VEGYPPRPAPFLAVVGDSQITVAGWLSGDLPPQRTGLGSARLRRPSGLLFLAPDFRG